MSAALVDVEEAQAEGSSNNRSSNHGDVENVIATASGTDVPCTCQCSEAQGEGGEEDEDEDEEVDVVQVEVHGIIENLADKDSRRRQILNAKFVGLETDTPFVQIGNQTFAGTLEHSLGTSIFFSPADGVEARDDENRCYGGSAWCDDDDDNGNGDDVPVVVAPHSGRGDPYPPVFLNRPAKQWTYVCKMDKKLVLKRVFLSKKEKSE